jgi:hypothetical protein
MITHDPRWSLPRGNTLVPSRWQATRFEPVSHAYHGLAGGVPGWQTALTAVGAAIMGAVLAVLLDRARAARRHGPATVA